MGRIVEALRKAEMKRGGAVETLPPPHPYQPEEDPSLRAEAEEETPFIEVGGPRTALDASPSVLTSNPNHRLASPIRQTMPKHTRTPSSVDLFQSDAPPVRIAEVEFRALPCEMPPLRPAVERFAPELVALHQPVHPVSEQYRVLMRAIAQQLPAGQSQVLLFAAAANGNDSTAVVLNLAITRAKQGKAGVVLVDANVRRPSVADRLGLPVAPGLGDVLAGGVSLDRAVQETGQANLHALTAGIATATSPRRVAGEKMRAILRCLCSRFDWVLVDAPCWDGRPDVVALGAACDAVYLVAPQADAGTPRVQELIQLIPEQGACLRGCVLTKP